MLHEQVHGVRQGGMIQLPIPNFPTGVMRGRFRPQDQELYLCGMFAWAGDATAPGGLYRLRVTERPVILPTELHAQEGGLQLVFSEPIDPKSVTEDRIAIKTWSLKRSKRYGSDHHNEKQQSIRSMRVSADGKRIDIELPKLKPTWCMEIQYEFQTLAGEKAEGVIHNTIHVLDGS